MKKNIFLIFLILNISCLCLLAQSNDSPVKNIRELYQNLEQKRYNKTLLTEFRTQIDELLSLAVIKDNDFYAGTAHRYLALYYLLDNEIAMFLPEIQKSTEFFEKAGAKEEIIKNKLNCGNFYLQHSEYDKLSNHSFSTLYEALELSYDIKNHPLTVSSYFYLGYIYQNKFIEYEEAVKCYEKAIELLTSYNVDFPLWKLYNNICNCYIYTEQYDKARTFLEKLYEILLVSDVGDADWRLYHLNYGILENRLRNFQLAEEYIQKALVNALKFSDKKIIELCYQNLIEIGKASSDDELEKKYLIEAYNYFLNDENLSRQLLYGTLLGKYYLELGELDKCNEQLKIATNISLKVDNYRILTQYYRTLSDFYEANGNYRLSLAAERKYGVCRDSVLSAEHKLDVVRTVSHQSLAEKKLEIKKLHDIINIRQQREHEIIFFTIALAILLSSLVFLYINLNNKKKKLIEEQQKHIGSITKMLNIRNALINFDEDETHSIEGLVDWVTDLLKVVFDETDNIEILVKIGDYQRIDNQLDDKAIILQDIPIYNEHFSGSIRIRGLNYNEKSFPQIIPGILQFGKHIAKTLRFIELKKQLQNNEVRFRSIFSQIREGLVIVDPQKYICDWNSEAENITSISGIDVIGKNIQQIIENIVPENGALVWQELTSVNGNEIQLLSHNHKIIMFKVFPVIIDKMNYFCLSIMDITYQEELKKQLILNEKMASLGIMTAGIAHEINQPLTTITFTMENLIRNLRENQLDQDSLLKKVNHLQESMDRLTDFIQKILSYSSQNASFSEVFELNIRVDEALKWNLAQIHNNDIEIHKLYSPQKIYLQGSRIRFDEIIINLISNAITSLKETSHQREITIITESENDLAVIKIKDNGIGIDQANLKKIFLPFFSYQPQQDSTGLGLSIVYNIVKEMKGDIQVFSKKNEWCEFIIKLPSTSPNGEFYE